MVTITLTEDECVALLSMLFHRVLDKDLGTPAVQSAWSKIDWALANKLRGAESPACPNI